MFDVMYMEGIEYYWMTIVSKIKFSKSKKES